MCYHLVLCVVHGATMNVLCMITPLETGYLGARWVQNKLCCKNQKNQKINTLNNAQNSPFIMLVPRD